MHASQVFDDPSYYLARCLPENGTDFDREVREFRHCVTAALRKCHAPKEMQAAAQDKTVDISRRNDIHSLLASCSYGSMCSRIESLEQSELTSLHRIKELELAHAMDTGHALRAEQQIMHLEEEARNFGRFAGLKKLEERMKRMHNEIRNGAERMRQLERMVDPNAELPGPDLLG